MGKFKNIAIGLEEAQEWGYNEGAYNYKFKDEEKPKTLSPEMALKLWEILDYLYINDEGISVGPNGETFREALEILKPTLNRK